MGSIFCSKCNSEINDQVSICPVCGKELENTIEQCGNGQPKKTIIIRELLKRVKRKHITIASIIFVTVIAVIIVITTILPDATDKFFKLIEQGRVADAMVLYQDDISNDNKQREKANASIIKKVEELRNGFFDGKQDYKSTIEELNEFSEIDDMNVTIKFSEIKSEIENLNNSNIAYEAGLNYEKGNKAKDAALEYMKVIAQDKNYNNAMKRLSVLAKTIYSSAESLYEKREYKGTVELAQIVKSICEKDDSDKSTECLANANDLILKSKKKEYENKVEISEDSIDNKAFIFPKVGQDVVRTGWGKSYFGYLFYPYIAELYNSNEKYFIIFFEFSQADWLFMKEIKLKCGNISTNFSIEDEQTNVDNGITEKAYIYPDSEQINTLTTMFNDDSNEVILRVYGSGDHIDEVKDITLTDEQKIGMKTMLGYWSDVLGN